jgi:DNA (cytosine-5)-methyltransferase 1
MALGPNSDAPLGGHYGVKLVRGPFVKLSPHPEACADVAAFLAYAARLGGEGAHLAADLFSGGGGLGLGLEDAGYRVVLAADHDPEAVETHRHHFGGLTLDWDLGNTERISEVADLISKAKVELLAGGPPCQPFSKAGRSKIRHRVRHGLRDPNDERKDLWRSFLEVVRIALPPAVIMENVPDMALDREMFIFRALVYELEVLGYAVEQRLVEAWRYGVPQFRQRLILVALRDGVQFSWPEETPDKVTVANAIGDLPPVEGGWRPVGGAEGWKDYDGPVTDFQRRMRRGISEADSGKIFDHITRPVRLDDERAFELMDSNTLYSDLPSDVKRYRSDIFDDKYKRLHEHGLSRTITAHIAKDGYWYIHPTQNRTLTVREAARLQTFPDRFRFAGPPSAAFRQIGNAVPPILGEHLGRAIRSSLDQDCPAEMSTQQIAERLASWFESLPQRAMPWLRAQKRWQVLVAELLLDRLAAADARSMWPLIERWVGPEDTLRSEAELREMARWLGRSSRANKIVAMAEQLQQLPGLLEDDDALRQVDGVTEAVADLAVLAVPVGLEDESEEPVLAGRGVLRVAARFAGDQVDRRNRLTDGRLAVARMIGDGQNARSAHLGLIELAAGICRPVSPACTQCPLRDICTSSEAEVQLARMLF